MSQKGLIQGGGGSAVPAVFLVSNSDFNSEDACDHSWCQQLVLTWRGCFGIKTNSVSRHNKVVEMHVFWCSATRCHLGLWGTDCLLHLNICSLLPSFIDRIYDTIQIHLSSRFVLVASWLLKLKVQLSDILCRSIVFVFLILFSPFFPHTGPLTRYLETGCSESNRTWQSGRYPWEFATKYFGEDLH